jgi:recombination protein RecR
VYEGSLQDLIDALGRLPGVGPKSAQRLAFHLLQTDAATVENLAKLLLEVKQKVVKLVEQFQKLKCATFVQTLDVT